MSRLSIKIPVNPFKQELRDIKKRQKERKAVDSDKLGKMTEKDLLVMLLQGISDIQENQARIENDLNAIKQRLNIK